MLVAGAVTPLVVGLALPVAASASPAPIGTGSVVTIGQYDHVMAPPVTGAQRDAADAKLAQARAYVERALAARTGAKSSVAPLATSKSITMDWALQQESSWCGPATLAHIATQMSFGWSGTEYQKQSGAANLLGVTPNGPGTPWIGSDNVPLGGPWVSSYPMQDALNYKYYMKHGGIFYGVTALPGSPTSAQINDYKIAMLFDIDNNDTFANNEYAAPGYQHTRQPSGQWIMHRFATSGYAASGGTVYFNDSGWGTGSGPSSDTVHDVVVSLGGRGYVW